MSKQVPTSIGMPMEGFFESANTVAEAMTFASIVATQGALAKALVSPFEPILMEESTKAEKVVSSESSPIPTKIFFP